jgi:hypothetical protein
MTAMAFFEEVLDTWNRWLEVENRAWRDVVRAIDEISEVEYWSVRAGDFDMVVLLRAASNDLVRNIVLGQSAMPCSGRTRR